jgi:hypothetical protein
MPPYKKFKDRTCVYCATRPATTQDHVIARAFFLVARRGNLPKVQAPTAENSGPGKVPEDQQASPNDRVWTHS